MMSRSRPYLICLITTSGTVIRPPGFANMRQVRQHLRALSRAWLGDVDCWEVVDLRTGDVVAYGDGPTV